jgi:hypothetical protein
MEPPFRILVRAALRYLPASIHTRSVWEISRRPHYLLGVYTAACLARRQNVGRIAVVEFGVAGGEGLLALEEDARAVAQETGVEIRVYGFDAGAGGLPPFCGDYRDHPDFWRPGDFPMDVDALKSKLDRSTQLILGDVAETVPRFVAEMQTEPVGFVAIDLDLYSSTCAALQLFAHPGKRMLRQVPIYLDDVDLIINHRFAGELLAIEEFNRDHADVKIDRWRGVRKGRPFPERPYLDKLFVAHDLKAISGCAVERSNASLPLRRR